MSKEADYDPQSAAISSAYVSAFNDYVRQTLKFGTKMTYKEGIDVEKNWDFLHQPPGRAQQGAADRQRHAGPGGRHEEESQPQGQMNGGYFDLATPFFAATYELQQLPIQPALQKNIEMHFYTSGHMVYAHEPDLKALHDNVAAFIGKTHEATVGDVH